MTAKLTGETVTDEQIREMRDTYTSTGDSDKYHHAMIALGKRRSARRETRAMSRQRCADLLNARLPTTKGAGDE